MAREKKQRSEGDKVSLGDRAEERSREIQAKLEKALEPCKDDPAVKKAMEVLPGDRR